MKGIESEEMKHLRKKGYYGLSLQIKTMGKFSIKRQAMSNQTGRQFEAVLNFDLPNLHETNHMIVYIGKCPTLYKMQVSTLALSTCLITEL